MPIRQSSASTTSRHWLRVPTPDAGAGTELFIFTGVAIFNGLKGTGNTWERGDAIISADYTNVIPVNRAILPIHWSVDIHLASVFNANVANNTGWAVDTFRLLTATNGAGGGRVAAASGNLMLSAGVAVRDSDAYIHRLAYHVTILGRVVAYQPYIS